MGLDSRLRILESKVKPKRTPLAPRVDIDQCMTSLGLIPEAVRELACSKGSNLAEAMAEMLGIEFREFKREMIRRADRRTA